MTGEGRTKGRIRKRENKKREREGRRKGIRREGMGRKGEKKGVNGKDQNGDSICSNVIFKGNKSAARPLKRKEKKSQQGMKPNVRDG